MNILFMSLIDFESIEQKNIYTDLLRQLCADGHKIYVISPIERKKGKQTYIISGENCVIVKTRIGNIQKTNYIEKGISTLMLEGQIKKSIKKFFSDVHFDMVLYATPPITFQKVISYVKRRDSAVTYLMLKDIWPQGLVDLGVIRKTGLTGILYRMFRNKEKKLYQVSDVIGCMSPANMEYVLSHNSIDKECVELCPNAIEPANIEDIDVQDRSVLKKYHIPEDKVLMVYGGNLGRPQGIEFLLQTIQMCENKKVFFVIVGNGTEYSRTQKYIEENGLENVRLIQALPKEEYEGLLQCCDVGLIFLDKRFTIPNYPSRLLSYMDKGKAVLAATDKATDIGITIESGEFGYWCESGDIQQMLGNIDCICNNDRYKSLGCNARRYLLQNFNVKNTVKEIEKHIGK